MKDIEGIFVKIGGDFTSPPILIQEKLPQIKAIIFDWDGVFNSGQKSEHSPSGFSEGDAMGINMLRFSFYLKFGFAPAIFIVTGEQNPTAIKLAKREHFDSVFFGVKNKIEVLQILKDKFNFNPEQCIFIFDDILDLSLAKVSGLRFFVRKTSNPRFNKYVLENACADYMTGHAGHQNAVREICELVISLNENYNETIGNRVDFSEIYTTYFTSRNSKDPIFFRHEEGGIGEFKP